MKLNNVIMWNVVVLVVGDLTKIVSSQLLLADQSWSVTSVINFRANMTETRGIHVLESYSPSQRKATIHLTSSIENQSKEIRETFYLDQKYNMFVFTDKSKEKCESTTLTEFYKKIRLDLSDIDIEDYLTSKDVIGPARLLYFIENHRSKLKLMSLGEKVYVRNILCLEYEMAYETKKGSNIKFNIFYDSNLVVQNVDTLPIKIFMEFNDQEISIDFSLLSPLRDMPVTDGEIFHDTFVIPTICTQPLIEEKKDFYLLRDPRMVRFSFNAKISTKTGRKVLSESFNYAQMNNFDHIIQVTYDLALSSLRIDTKTSDNKLIQEVTNFKVRRRHLVIEDLSVVGMKTNNEMNCTVFRTPQVESEGLMVGNLFTGKTIFTHLGKAIVRGIPANIRSSFGGSIPFWLDQPIEYKVFGSSYKLDPSLGPQPSKNARKNVTTVIYFSDQELPIPLLMTVRTPDRFHTIEMLDFFWELDHSKNPSEIFSLHDSCTAFNKPHNHVNLFLSGNEKILEKPTKPALELTLLAALQDSLALPVTMTYDLKYQFLGDSLAVSLNVASYTNMIAELNFLGRGKRNYRHSHPLTVRKIRSFQMCYQLAASWKVDLFFAFTSKSLTCSIDLKTPTNNVTQSAFALEVGSVTAPLEVYQVRHLMEGKVSPGSEPDEIARWIEEKRFRALATAKLLGKKLKLYPLNPVRDFIFTLESLKIDAFEPTNFGFTKANETVNLDTFIGFALKENSENRRILVPSSHSRSWASKENEFDASLMSFAQCQSACMFDAQCKSYSICQRGYQLECVVSKFSFRSSSVAEQLMKFSASSSATKQIQVTLDDQKTIELIKSKNCELHNKLYLNLFYPGRSYIYFLKDELLQPVLGIEDCAKLCIDINLLVLSEDAKLSKQLSELAIITADFSASEIKRFNQILSTRNENSGLLCNEFLYLDRSQLADENQLRDIEQRTLDSAINPNDAEGFCQISAYKRGNESKSDFPSVKLTFRRYEFILESFYEALKGVQLRASPISDSDFLSYNQVKHSYANINFSSYLSLQELVESGHNFQEHIYGDSAKCASICFQGALSHTMGPWPVCRSYDIKTDPMSGVKTCYLNSITIQDAISNDKLGLIVESDSSLTHYEPSFILQEASPDGSHQLIELELQVDAREKNNQIRLDTLCMLVIVTLATCCGLFLGVELAQKVTDYQTNHDHVGRDNIRKRLTELVFSNQVSGTGTIPE